MEKGNALRAKLNKIKAYFKTVFRVTRAEIKKLAKIPSFWVLTGIMCVIAVGGAIYENTTLIRRDGKKEYSDEPAYVQTEWIERLKESVDDSKKSLAEKNMSEVSRRRLEAQVANNENQLLLLQYLKDNRVPLYLSEGVLEEADYVYYVKGIAYRFSEITFTIPDEDAVPEVPLSEGAGGASEVLPEVGMTYKVLSDGRAGDSIFEANLIFYFVAVLLVVLAFSDEFTTGTVKLLVSKPVKRRDIGIAKLNAITFLLFVSWLLAVIIYLLTSLCFKNSVSYAVIVGGHISLIPVRVFNLTVFFDILMVSLGFIALSSVFGVRFKNNIAPVILPFLVYFFKTILIRVVPNLAFLDLFENLRLLEHYALGNVIYGAEKLWLALLMSIGVMFVLMALALRRFSRYDFDKQK